LIRISIPPNHPRAKSLQIREKLIEYLESGVIAPAGLIAHGRGEAFDYLLGEKTSKNAVEAIEAAACALLLARLPVISVNGNVAALASKEIMKLSKLIGAKIEINLFYRSHKREKAVKRALKGAGIVKILGTNKKEFREIVGINSMRRYMDNKGTFISDVVLVPLEDGDRTEELVKMGKIVIAIDLNPLSRTAQNASITIVDNIIRSMPLLIEKISEFKIKKRLQLEEALKNFDNNKNLDDTIHFMAARLINLSCIGK
jgi:4-phosphopantoate--beta-alanine ligase